MRAGIALYLALASADRLLEATVREAAMSSPEWWEAHHQLARLKPGTSWFGPIGRAIARDIAKRYGRTCAPGDAVVLGSGLCRNQISWRVAPLTRVKNHRCLISAQAAAFQRRLIGWRAPGRSDASTGLIAQFRP